MQVIGGDTFRQGQHICAVYDTAEEQVAVAVAYVADGLAKHERCLYVADSGNALDWFRAELRKGGLDADAMEASGALLLSTKDRAHLAEGRFDSERMLRMLNDAVEQALNDGFAGLRTCGDMSWLLDDAPGSDQVVEYEAVLNAFFRNVRGLGMCQYDRHRLPARLLDRAGIAAHSSVVVGHEHQPNPFCQPIKRAESERR
jgi:hypothetical protein